MELRLASGLHPMCLVISMCEGMPHRICRGEVGSVRVVIRLSWDVPRAR